MIYEISKSRGLELLFSRYCDDATLCLFQKLLDVYPVPKLSEIKVSSFFLNVYLTIIFL